MIWFILKVLTICPLNGKCDQSCSEISESKKSPMVAEFEVMFRFEDFLIKKFCNVSPNILLRVIVDYATQFEAD